MANPSPPESHPTPVAISLSDSPSSQPQTRLLDHAGIPWLVLTVMLLITIVLWQLSEQQLEQRTQERFIYLANKEGNVIQTRMQAYEQVLRGAAALFASSEFVNREEWRKYIETLELDQSLPGILGTGYAVVIPPGQRDAHEQQVRAEGFADYRILPPGERELISSIIYLEPFNQRNQRAFGYDMYSEPVRRAAMAQARDSGKATLTGKVTLMQEFDDDIQPGFLMYLPVYRNDMSHDDIGSRRTALQGFVYSPFRAHDLMSGVLQSSSQDLNIELFDGEPLADNLLYRATDTLRSAQHVTDLKLQVAGRFWTARIHSSRDFENTVVNHQSLLILIAGIGLDLALFSILLINARRRRGMRKAAAKLKQSRDSFRTLVENVPGTVFRSQAEAPWILQHVSAGIETLIGEPPKRFLSGETTLRQYTHPDDLSMLTDAIEQALAEHSAYNVEYRLCSRSNELRWVTERGRASYDHSGLPLWVDGVILDITDRKVAELAIRDLAFFDPLTGLPNRRVLIDRLTQQVAVTHRSQRYDALLFIDMDNFKTINDSLGHEAGDLLLIEVARRLLGSVRENDTVARLGGDEFVVILDNLSNNSAEAITQAQRIGAKLIRALNQPYQLGEHSRHSSPSIGLTVFSGHEVTVEELLRQADQAMYVAKSAGRNCLKAYQPKSPATKTPSRPPDN